MPTSWQLLQVRRGGSMASIKSAAVRWAGGVEVEHAAAHMVEEVQKQVGCPAGLDCEDGLKAWRKSRTACWTSGSLHMSAGHCRLPPSSSQ